MIALPIFMSIPSCTPTPRSPKKVWAFASSSTMRAETLFFANDMSPRCSQLLFLPTKILKVESADESTVYVEGEDFTVDKEAGVLHLTETSRIPCSTLYGDVLKHGQWKDEQGRFILWGEGDFIHQLQVKVTYEHKGNQWSDQEFLPTHQSLKLPRVTDSLKNKLNLRVVLTGDSISEGYNASGFVGAAPHLPPYGVQVAKGLKSVTGNDVDFLNVSKAGQTSSWGLTQLETITAHQPDLVIIAFGMNDAGRNNHQKNSEHYEASIRGVITGVRHENPRAEFILVANMLPNSKFKPHEGHWMNREKLLGICDDTAGVAIADVMKVTEAILERKKFSDISGNHLNHPNDFLHRVYASVILHTLGASEFEEN